MGYAEAIEQQMATLHFWSGVRGLRRSGLIWRDLPDEQRETYGSPAGVQYDIVRPLELAEPFAIAAPICDLIGSASQTVPSMTLRAQDLPAPYGWLYFERHLSPGSPQSNDRDMMGLPIAAISWRIVRIARGADMFGTTDADDPNGIAWVVYVREPGERELTLAASSSWSFGESWDTLHRNGAMDHRIDLVGRYLATLFAFMAERVLVSTSRKVVNRQARKRLAKHFDHEPIVKVIELRRREYQQRDESQAALVEWHCRWLVRGHWRQQFFPASGEHRPIWIMPHVKGPDTKPLKTPRTIAYEVVR